MEIILKQNKTDRSMVEIWQASGYYRQNNILYCVTHIDMFWGTDFVNDLESGKEVACILRKKDG